MNQQERWCKKTTKDILSGKNNSRKDAIRAFCWGCVGYDTATLKNCCGTECPLYPFRMGGGLTREISDETRKKYRENMKSLRQNLE